MKRGNLYLVRKGDKNDPKKQRIYLVVSRQELIGINFPTVICAPILSSYEGLKTQVELGVEDGLKYDCAVHCDGLISLPKSILTNYISTLSASKIQKIDEALRIALAIG